MTIAHAYTLLIEAVVLAASFGTLWLSFWARDRRRETQPVRQPLPTDAPVPDLASPQQDLVTAG